MSIYVQGTLIDTVRVNDGTEMLQVYCQGALVHCKHALGYYTNTATGSGRGPDLAINDGNMNGGCRGRPYTIYGHCGRANCGTIFTPPETRYLPHDTVLNPCNYTCNYCNNTWNL